MEKLIERRAAKERAQLAEVQADRASLRASVEAFIKDKGSYEDEDIKITRVQGHRRSWNVDKLQSILPRGIFKNVTKTTVDGDKIDRYVREGKIKLKDIDPAFEETPNAPYVKWTDKSDGTESASEVEGLAAALGK